MLKPSYRILLFALALSSMTALQAQTENENADISEFSQDDTVVQSGNASLDMPVQLATTQTAPLPAGVCTVISGVLAELCENNPGDISCSFQ